MQRPRNPEVENSIVFLVLRTKIIFNASSEKFLLLRFEISYYDTLRRRTETTSADEEE